MPLAFFVQISMEAGFRFLLSHPAPKHLIYMILVCGRSLGFALATLRLALKMEALNGVLFIFFYFIINSACNQCCNP